VPDFDRPLNRRGEKAARFMGRYMAENGLVPDRAIVSTAARTRATLAGLLPSFDGDLDIRLTRVIYEASPVAILKTIHTAGEPSDRLLVVGHNPGLQSLAALLAGRGSSDGDLDALKEHFPTAALAVLDLDVPSWDAAASGTAVLARFVRPRDMMDED